MKTILVAKVNLLHITVYQNKLWGKKNLLNSLIKQMVRHYLEFIQSKERKKKIFLLTTEVGVLSCALLLEN